MLLIGGHKNLPKNKELKSQCRTEISPLGQKDLDEIFRYFAQNNYDAAVKFFNQLGAKFRLLSENTKLGASCEEYVIGMRKFPYKNYVIFYFPLENGIEIYRVIHGARDIDEMFDELIEGLKP